MRFHAVYWPAFLMSAGIALPKQVYGHGFLLSRGEKMSKSVGNVVDPIALADRFGVDALRYFLLREVTFGQDGSYSAEAIVARANAELANSFGNLAQRVLTQIVRNCGGGLPEIHGHNDADNALFAIVCSAASETMPAAYESLALAKACEIWIHAVFACNAYIDEQAPWTLRKTDPARMETVLATLYICIAVLAVAIRPVIPGSADRLLDAMGVKPELRTFDGILSHWYSPLAEGDFRLAAPTPLFPRIELRGGRGGAGVRLIDSHCHLNYEGLAERQDEVLAAARERGSRRLPQHLDPPAGVGRCHRGRRAQRRCLGERRRPPARSRRPSRPRRVRAGVRGSQSAGDCHR